MLMDGEADSGEPRDNGKDVVQDPSGKSFLPLLAFCKAGKMKNDNSVGKSEKNTESLGVEQHYSKINNEELSNDVVGDGRPKSLAALFSIQQMDHRDSIISSSSGHLLVPAGSSTSCYDSMSFRSNSTTSTRSFAFPVLASDWNESPVRMGDGHRRFSRKRRYWSMCFGCYNV